LRIQHFYPRSHEIGFLNKYKEHLKNTYSEDYNGFERKGPFVYELSQRLDITDIIIVTAHGNENGFTADVLRDEVKELNFDELHIFNNSFVFAFSCSTASLGKRLCDQLNVISYIGFDDIIDLKVNTGNKEFKTDIGQILQSIYINTLIHSFDEFLRNSYTIEELSRLIAFNLKKYHAVVLGMSAEDISRQFNIPMHITKSEKFINVIKMDLLTTVHDVSKRIQYHGEGNFIPWKFIEGKNPYRIMELIQKIEKASFKPKNEYYKHFLLAYMYREIDHYVEAAKNIMKVREQFQDYVPLSSIDIPAIKETDESVS